MDIRSEQKIYVDLIYFPLKTLGPKDRLGIWLQGCDILCKNCISSHNLIQKDEKIMQLDDLIEKILKFDKVERLTISGGEPFFQANALYKLLLSIRFKFNDILVYSGYKFDYLERKYSHILDLIDVLIDGEFDDNQLTKKTYKGSENQKLYIFNTKLIPIYSEYIKKNKKMFQLYQADNTLYLLGIPRIEDKNVLNKLLNKDINV